MPSVGVSRRDLKAYNGSAFPRIVKVPINNIIGLDKYYRSATLLLRQVTCLPLRSLCAQPAFCTSKPALTHTGHDRQLLYCLHRLIIILLIGIITSCTPCSCALQGLCQSSLTLPCPPGLPPLPHCHTVCLAAWCWRQYHSMPSSRREHNMSTHASRRCVTGGLA